MNFLLFQLKRLLMAPIQLFLSLGGSIHSLWGDSVKSRALLLGLPSVIFAVAGIAFLCWAKFGIADSLENRYKADAEKSAKEKSRLVDVLRRELRMRQATQRSSGGEGQAELGDLIPKDDDRRVALEDWRNREEIYLEKLIELNPEESEYLFQLAIVSFEKGNPNRGLALMNLTAPLDEPGYVKAHLWLAEYHMRRNAKSRSEAAQNVAIALHHAEQCLLREQNNVSARQIKAGLLFAQRKFEEAYPIYDELFDEDARYYKKLLEINSRLEKESRNNLVLEKAIGDFQRQLRSERLEEPEHLSVWNELISCYKEKKDYATAERKLLEEIERQSISAEDLGKRVWAERLLATIYLGWISLIDQEKPDANSRRLEYLRKAYHFDATNSVAMRELTRMGANADPAIALEAKKIYDAAGQSDAPASVLNEIGSQSLARAEYDAALRYFEMARLKAPTNPEILNNLAYTYTVISTPNPKRGLKLIDEALRNLPNTKASQKYRSFFHDTRGQTLMQLGRMTEAAAEFEFALQDRPKHRGILEAIVKCYSASGLDASAYLERLRQLDEDESESEDSNQAVETPGG